MSKVSAIYHIVINTYARRMTIPEEHKKELYMYIFGLVRNLRYELFRINGIPNHIHLLIDLHPTVALADLVKTLKQSTGHWMKANPDFAQFEGWGKEYFAFSVSQTMTDTVKQYIINQEEHHRKLRFEDELKNILVQVGIEWNDHLLT